MFAKYKSLSQRTSMKGIGKTILSIPAFTSTIAPATVTQALESVTCKHTAGWIQQHLGTSLFAKCMQAFGDWRRAGKLEKKPRKDPFKAASF